MDDFQPNRQSVRFRGYDYSAAGAYFITICAHRHRLFFGDIEDGVLQPNWVARLIEREWNRVAQLRPEIAMDEYTVMPNHFHAIVLISPVVATDVAKHVAAERMNTGIAEIRASEMARMRALRIAKADELAGLRANGIAELRATDVSPHVPTRTLSMLVNGFKGSVTRAVNQRRALRGLSPVVVWQSRFYDRIIRDEKELIATRRYIIENPANWHRDQTP